MVLFDIRHDDSHAGYIAAVNLGLDSEPGNPYLSRYGHVGTPRWWARYDRGELPVKLLAGEVTYVGPRQDWCDEQEDVIEFSCGGRTIVYDRLDHWAAHPIGVGDWVCVTRTVAELATRTGPMVYLIDLRAEWLAASVEQSTA